MSPLKNNPVEIPKLSESEANLQNVKTHHLKTRVQCDNAQAGR